MKALKRLATQNAVLFGLLISLIVLAAYTVTAVLAAAISDERAGYEQVETTGRLAASLFFLYVLWRFGWLESAGVTKRGAFSAWVITLVVLAYDLVTTTYALFGNVDVFGISDPVLSASVAANALMTGLIEEIPFRGMILYAFLRLWGDSRRGVVKGVLYCSLLFGGIHIVHIFLGRPVAQALLVAIATFISGILYAAFVLRWKTIWTVVLLHGVANAVVALGVIETPGFTETVSAFGMTILLQLPLVAYGAYLIYRVPSQPVIPDAS